MPPEGGEFWQKWLAKHGERIRMLCALQEEAIRQQDWDALNQIALEKEQILESLWQYPPAQLPPEVLAFAQDLWIINQRLQQMMAERMRSLREDMAQVHRTRETVQRYRVNPTLGSVEDRAA